MAIKAAARKADVKMASGGSVTFLFDHKVMFTGESKHLDKCSLRVSSIEFGVDDFIMALSTIR
jgi:transcriptional/translational regulatory protein YebC/TACO1